MRLLVTLARHTCSSHLLVTLARHTCSSHLFVTLARHTFLSHLLVTLVCHTFSSHFFVTLARHTCLPHLLVTLFVTLVSLVTLKISCPSVRAPYYTQNFMLASCGLCPLTKRCTAPPKKENGKYLASTVGPPPQQCDGGAAQGAGS